MLKFRITESDIASGVRKNVNDCAAARAIRREMPDAKQVSVSPHCVRVYIGPLEQDDITYPTPQELAEFIYRYDRDMTVEPMEIVLA